MSKLDIYIKNIHLKALCALYFKCNDVSLQTKIIITHEKKL